MKQRWIIMTLLFIFSFTSLTIAIDSDGKNKNEKIQIAKEDYDNTVSSIHANRHSNRKNGLVLGQDTGSAYFRGSNRIRVLDNYPVNPNADPSAYVITGNTITAEAWIFPMSLPAHQDGKIIVSRPYWEQEPWHAYELRIDNWGPTDNPRFTFVVSDGNVPANIGQALAPDPVATGSWVHVAGAYDGSMVRLYINGNLLAETPYTANIGAGNTGFYIGGLGWQYFNGLIDEVRLWNISRSQEQIQVAMNTTLHGVESGLVGYWPLDEATEVNGNSPVTVDLTENHNDLWVQYGTDFVDAIPGSEVSIAPYLATTESLEGVVGEAFTYQPIASGWPVPEISFVSGPTVMSFDAGTGRVNWTPASGQNGYHNFTLQATNPTGSIQGTYRIWVDVCPLAMGQHNNNNTVLSVFNNGIVGAKNGADPDEGDVGFQFNGADALCEGDLVIAQSENQVSGGLYIREFGTQSSIDSITSYLPGFNQAFEARFNDQRAPNPLGFSIIQKSYSKSTSPDDDYVIMEYEILNTSGSMLYGIYVGLAMDWDVGNYGNNLGGYDTDRKLSYMYEAGGGNNSNYYGVAVLKGEVSGHAIWAVGSSSDSDDAILYNRMTSFTQSPTVPADQRDIIGVGPYDILAGGKVSVVFSILGGTNLADLQTNADAALSIVTGVDDNRSEIPNKYALSQNYPNPFNIETVIRYQIPSLDFVTLKIYDILAREIQTLVSEVQEAGKYSINFDASKLSSGIYFYRLQVGNDFVETRKMLLIR